MIEPISMILMQIKKQFMHVETPIQNFCVVIIPILIILW